MSESAFYYVDGDPTKGKWIDLDILDDEDEILEELAEANLIPRDEIGDPEYGGDLLVADTIGTLAKCFLNRCGSFDLDDFIEARNLTDSKYGPSSEAVAAYIGWLTIWNKSDFRDKYIGEYDSEQDFLRKNADDLLEIPKHLRGYIDYESMARDFFVNDYHFADGHVFRQ